MKTGFFVQKECASVAVAQCSNCKKYFCLDHIYGGLEAIKNRKRDEGASVIKAKTDEEAILCLECYALKNKETVQKQYEGGYTSSNTSDLLWYFYMRDRFYQETRFQPFSDSDKDSLKTTSQDFDDSSSSNSFFDS
ncbi:MAG: hypothetical protein OHK0045_19930 [Raineya sp.]